MGCRRDCDRGHVVGDQDRDRSNFMDSMEPFAWEVAAMKGNFHPPTRDSRFVLEADDDGWVASLNDARWCNCVFPRSCGDGLILCSRVKRPRHASSGQGWG